MERVLKGLEGKTLTKKKLFDFLADINLEDICGKKESNIGSSDGANLVGAKSQEDTNLVIENDSEEFRIEFIPIKEFKLDDTKPKKKVEEIRCKACMRTFTENGSLKRHYRRNPVCVNWISLPQKPDNIQLTQGIHHIVDDLLEKSVSTNGKLECRFCNSTFTNRGNLHKHFNNASVCNRLAFLEFKSLINNM